MIKLEFKSWFKLDEAPRAPSYPSQMYPANRAGLRDVRFGYPMNPAQNPPMAARIGSDIVTGLGSVFKKSMGAAMPAFGSGVRNYFDELTSAITDGKNYVIMKNVPYDEDEDDYKETHLREITKKALKEIRKIPKAIAGAEGLGIDLKDEPDTMYERSKKEGHILIIFRFEPQEKFSDKFRSIKTQ